MWCETKKNRLQHKCSTVVHIWLLKLIFIYKSVLLRNRCFLYQSRGNHPNDNAFKLIFNFIDKSWNFLSNFFPGIYTTFVTYTLN